MNEVCPYCREPQRFPVDCIDTVVYCVQCAKPFLLSKRRRDEVPAETWSDRHIRKMLYAALMGGCIVAWLYAKLILEAC